MKRSIRKQVTLVFTIILLCSIGLCILLNLFFLKPYYMSDKKNSLLSAYNTMDRASVTRTLSVEKAFGDINEVCEKGGLIYVILDPAFNVLLTSESETNNLVSHIRNLFLIDENTDRQLFDKEETYLINSYHDSIYDKEYLEMWGVLYCGEKFLIRVPVESIDNNVAVSVRFMIYVGLLSTLIGVAFIIVYTQKITKPILNLMNISSRMKDLDFNAKYESKTDNEIDLLGENINELSEKLKDTISELKSANATLVKDIKKRDEIESMRKEFTSNVSHELKTPIAIIQGYAEGLKEGVTDDEESRNYYLDVIIDESNRMNLLVKELMSLTELEFGNQGADYERFDICELINNKISTMDFLIKQNEIDLFFTKKDKSIFVWSDEFRIEGVFQNYLSNAIHYCMNEKLIIIDIEEMKDTIRITVFNTGNIIDEEQIDKIWDKFFKVDKARSRDYGGSGIGLSIVKASMESIGMDYGVFNSHNGVTFYFDLPTK